MTYTGNAFLVGICIFVKSKEAAFFVVSINQYTQAQAVLEILNNLWEVRNRVGIGFSYGPPGFTARRNWFLGIDF